MRILHLAILGAAIASAPFAAIAWQQSPASTLKASPSPAPPASGAQLPSAILQPALDGVKSALSSLNLEKWKRGSVRDEAQSNITSIMRDMQDVLPGMLSQADSAPAVITRTLPVSRNVDALYDVVLRVVDAARISAPREQVDALQRAQSGLERSRRTLDTQLQELAADQEKQVGSLQLALKQKEQALATAVPTPAAAPKPEPCAPVRKARPKKKSVPPADKQPSKSQPATQQPATPKPQS